MPKAAPYGTWKSPITAEIAAGDDRLIRSVTLDGDDIYWVESIPSEGGRYVVKRWRPTEGVVDCTPAGFYVRTTVHEYGGAAFTVADGTIYFINYDDQQIYRQGVGLPPEQLTPTSPQRYADLVVDHRRNRLICVREDHSGQGEAVNTIVSVSLSGGDAGSILQGGNDFYAAPRLSPDGTKLAYLTWNHPNMPWDGCELWVAEITADGRLASPLRVSGGTDESIYQPEWSPDGVLHFVSDRSGWWNLDRWRDGQVEALHPMEAEFGQPHWTFGMSSYGFLAPSMIVCKYTRDGLDALAVLDTATGAFTPIDSPYTDITYVRAGRGFAAFDAGSPVHSPSVVRYDSAGRSLQALTSQDDPHIDRGYLSIPEPVSFPTTGDKLAYGLYYPPKNRDFVGPDGERPPLLVVSHGGPTSMARTERALKYQFWTSRGFALLDVNYGGSSGYGREYRRRLNGNWGIVDVDDCCNGALYLAEQGLVDRKRLIIHGGSAGGYTTLACLTFRDGVFAAGGSHYGLANLEDFVTDTHKFESRYLTSLVGPYPERRDLYTQRSPIHFMQNLASPMIIFQGDEDKIVPPAQSEMMFQAIRAKGIPTAYLLFKGEQHGFRRAENIRRSFEAELYFYSKVFGFQPADKIDPVAIENLQ